MRKPRGDNQHQKLDPFGAGLAGRDENPALELATLPPSGTIYAHVFPPQRPPPVEDLAASARHGLGRRTCNRPKTYMYFFKHVSLSQRPLVPGGSALCIKTKFGRPGLGLRGGHHLGVLPCLMQGSDGRLPQHFPRHRGRHCRYHDGVLA